MPPPKNDRAPLELAKRLVDRAPAIRNACELDLMAFLYRHPRALLTTEQLAGFVGYGLKEIAGALDAFIEAGLLERTTQQSLHAARLFVLLLDGTHGGGVRALIELAATRQGRHDVLDALKALAGRGGQPAAGPRLRLVRRG